MTVPVPPTAAVIGTGRSGTGFMAAVLAAAGLNTGHEAYWHAHVGAKAPNLDVDSSWLALPLLETGPWSGRVLHVVRHPVDAIRSLAGGGFFNADLARAPYPMYARAHCPNVYGRTGVAAAVEFWCDWNNRCAAVADATVRLEDATGPEPVAKAWALTVADTIGLATVSPDDITAAVSATPTNTNTRGPLPGIDPAHVWSLIGRRAHAFGYGA
jgi:hypothetical protein